MSAWFGRLVALREKHPFRFPALFAVVCFVALARAELELLTATRAPFHLAGVLNNVAFYLLSAYLYAALARLLTGKRLESVAGIVAFGVFLGVFPPIIDALLAGTHHGYYRYVTDGLATFRLTLLNPAHYGTGEAVTLWILVAALPIYVLETTRSTPRTLLALVLSHGAVTFMAVGPSTLALALAEASPLGRGVWLLLLSLLQLFLAQVCYLCARPKVARRLLPRLLHGFPFVGLALLGGALSRLLEPQLDVPGGFFVAALAACLVLQLCAIALVQNDAHDADDDRRDSDSVRKEDADFFTTAGVLVVLVVLESMPGLGIPLALFLCVSTIYSYDFYRAKRFFPANYKCEGIWGWSSFVAGGSSVVTLRPETALPSSWLLGSLTVFGGFSLFNAFKDYKDIRADYKARIQTLYTLALRRGYRLRKLHNRLRAALTLAALLPAVGLFLEGGVAKGPLLLVTAISVAAFTWSLGQPPRSLAVKAYLASVTLFVFLLTAVVEAELRTPVASGRSLAPAAAPKPPSPNRAAADARCSPAGPWAKHAADLAFVAWLELRVEDCSGTSRAGCYPVAMPSTLLEVQQLVKRAAAMNAPIRIRGAGHSMNGSSLPEPGELVLSTAELNELRFETRGTVVAQAGLKMHTVQREVHAFGLEVPVVNDGPPAPTVGGYVSAGGLGEGSLRYGGFWENVAALTVVDGRGEVRRIAREDSDFLWFFGAMGQLGVVVEAELDTVAAENGPTNPADPYANRRRLRARSDRAQNPSRSEPLIWFTLLVSPGELPRAREELEALQARHAQELQMLRPYTYPFKDRGHVPPLFYGRPGPMTAVGIWARATSEQAASELDQAFGALCERQGFRRYIQTELTRGPAAYRRYFGPVTYEALLKLKRRMDPAFLFDRGTVFAAPN